MKEIGIVRKLDELGRITLPKELRKTLNILEKDKIEIFMEGEKICLKAYKSQCAFCKKEKNEMIELDGIHICRSCLKRAQDKANG